MEVILALAIGTHLVAVAMWLVAAYGLPRFEKDVK